MMELLVFLILLFGLFGVILTQYLSQYRSAYNLWDREIVFNGEKRKKENKCKLCSIIESYSRELCNLHDIISVIITLITCVIIIVSFAIRDKLYYLNFKIFGLSYAAYKDYYINLSDIQQLEFKYTLYCFMLVFLIFVGLHVLLILLKMSIFSKESKQSAIDVKLFDVWWKCKCHRGKNKNFVKNGQPSQLYKILAKKIKNKEKYVNDASEIEIELVKELYPNWFRKWDHKN